MPRILILGATGFIGNALSRSLLRTGNHHVWGVARTPEKARALSIQEITPVLCPNPVDEPAAYVDVIRNEHIDVVVDATGANAGVLKILEHIKSVGRERLEEAKKSGVSLPKLGFVYTSGMWVHGESKTPMSDLTPVGCALAPSKPADLVAARPGWEQKVLDARDVLDVAVVRPALVYGLDSWITGLFFGPIVEAARSNPQPESVQMPMTEDARPALVHIEDVASGMRKLVEKLPVLSGTGVHPVFDLMTSQEGYRDIAEGAAKAVGFEGRIDLTGPPKDDVFLRAMSTSLNGDSARARQLLGCQPRKVGLVQSIGVYARAFAASVEKSKL